MTWSAKQYLAFEDERTRPARDLVAAIATEPVRRAIDLGCGPGNSTEVLAARFGDAAITGLDSAPDMIAAARKRLPDLIFQLGEVNAWLESAAEREVFDVILANAVFQWIGDHKTLLPRLAARLSVGGALAIQMPDNLDEPSHALMRETAAKGPWADRLAGVARSRAPLMDAAGYYALLKPLFGRVDIWRTTYHHPLAGPSAIIEWFLATGLRPFMAPLNPVERAAFLDDYGARLAMAYSAQADGMVLLPFPRLFIVAQR